MNKAIENPKRLEEIVRLRLYEEGVDELLQQYVNRAKEEFSLPVSAVSVILDSAQQNAASVGLEGWIAATNGVPVEWSFCAHSVETAQPFVFEDGTQHPLMEDNPLVQVDGIKCYAGAPIVSKNGYVLGNFCVMGPDTRTFSQSEVDRLKEYAELVSGRLEERVAD